MIENLPLILTGIGLIASILYYSMNLRNANKTQKMQLEARKLDVFMKWHMELTKPETMMNMTAMNALEWSDFDDFQKKYDHSVNPEHASKRFAV